METTDNLIFVSIASYRDAQLVPTIADLIAKATHPERLRFGICWQHHTDDEPLPYLDDPRFRILDIDFRDSKGACWARAAIMNLWQKESWYFQVDSHCRFVTAWDDKLIATAISTGSSKPILSTYATMFTPGGQEILIGFPHQMTLQGFFADGIPQIKPTVIQDWHSRSVPMRARFLSGGFIFAPGSFVREVPYDPDLYFIGEESSMSLRAFTSGYDLFHPCENIVWHDYVRADSVRHWDDHSGDKAPIRQWTELDSRSREKVQRLVTGQPVDTFGLGSIRTLQQYEEYAGLSFALRKVQDYTLIAGEPPNPLLPTDWPSRIYTWMVRIEVEVAALPQGSFDNPHFWLVAIYDEHQHEIYRRDFPGAEIATVNPLEQRIFVICEFESGIVPAAWAIWPVSRDGGWLQKIQGTLPEKDYTIILDEDSEVSETLP